MRCYIVLFIVFLVNGNINWDWCKNQLLNDLKNRASTPLLQCIAEGGSGPTFNASLFTSCLIDQSLFEGIIQQKLANLTFCATLGCWSDLIPKKQKSQNEQLIL